jgi:hypothetical protein
MNKLRVAALLTALLMMASVIPAVAYASGMDPEEWTEEGEWHDFEEDSEKTDGLTPDGNLTLVDDYGDAPEAGQQFITLVTKNGNYFYLVIDRDKDGNENAHFMNLVDESDLFELLEDDAKDAYKAQIEAEQAAKEAAEKAAAEAAAAEAANLLPLFVVIFLILAGGGGWFLMQMKKKKKEEDTPDPDADYSDYEDDYAAEPEMEEEPEEDIQEDEEDGNDDDQ